MKTNKISLPFLTAPISAAALRAATRRNGHGILAEDVHFFHAASGNGFFFVDEHCYQIALAALLAEGYLKDEFKLDGVASGE